MLTRIHKRKAKRREDLQKEFALEEADRLSALVRHRTRLYDSNGSSGPNGSIHASGTEAIGGDMEFDMDELSINKEIRDRQKWRRHQRKMTESAKLRNYDQR